jgi:hypothetical protein
VQEPNGDTAQWVEFVRARDHYQTVSDALSGDPALVSDALDDMNSAYRLWCES